MLYDILFIDDDFEQLDRGEPANDDARRLFFELIRDNFRVTFTTGELEDLEKLKERDLSCIRYIFCDLHLKGYKEGDSYVQINSKLLGIFGELFKGIDSLEVTAFINSKFIDGYGDKGIEDLKNKLEKMGGESNPSRKFQIEIIEAKNHLLDKDREKLIENHLAFYLKSLIIAKALEVERIFDEKLRLSDNSRERMNLESKYLVFQSQFLTKSKKDKHTKRQFQLLKKIRNKAAHTDNAFHQIKCPDMKKTFWEIQGCDSESDEICFGNFDDLMKYIKSIDMLMQIIRSIEDLKLR